MHYVFINTQLKYLPKFSEMEFHFLFSDPQNKQN
jgi:hypothetical protein